MNNTVLVASREFTERLRSRAFLISNIAILAILLLALIVPNLFGDGAPMVVGHLDGDACQIAQLALGQQGAFDLDIEVTAIVDRQAAEAALEAGEVEAVLLDATTVLADGNLGPRLEALLANASNSIEVDTALAEAGLDPEKRASLFAID